MLNIKNIFKSSVPETVIFSISTLAALALNAKYLQHTATAFSTHLNFIAINNKTYTLHLEPLNYLRGPPYGIFS
jgi:hypothetical protein